MNNISNNTLLLKKISKMHLEVWEVLITYVTNREKVRVMLHIGAGHNNSCQIILKLFRYDIFRNNLQHIKFQANFDVSEVLITYFTNSRKVRVMLHMGAGHSNNCQIILNCSNVTYFAIIGSKKFLANLEVSEVLITYVTNGGKTRVMLHIGAGGHSNNCQIILKLFRYDIFRNITCSTKSFKKISMYQRF